MEQEIREYLEEIEGVFREHGSPEKAKPMARYMRDKFLFLGINSPLRNDLSREFLQKSSRPPYEKLDLIVPQLWDLPEREFQYLGIALVEKYKKEFLPDLLPLLEFMLVEKPWWDTVDMIAKKLVGNLFYVYPDLRVGSVERWLASGNIWLQRAALLFQLGYREETDWELLADTIQRLKGSKEFFIQKAIGWVLREYSRSEPERVRNFIAKANLAALSEREGLRFLEKKPR